MSRGPEPPIGIFSPPPKPRTPINITIPGRCTTCFTYALVQRMRTVSKGLCSIVRMCARVVHFGLTVGCWFGTRPGPSVLLVAIFTLIRSSWLSKGTACITLGAALLNLHRPLRQCRALSGLAVSCMTWGWSLRLLRLFVLAWALYQPLFRPRPTLTSSQPTPTQRPNNWRGFPITFWAGYIPRGIITKKTRV